MNIIKKIDLTDRTYGNLYVIERLAKYKNNKTYYRCRCKCGNERIVYSYDLTSGKVTTCHTCGKEIGSQKRRIDRTGERFDRLVILEMLYRYKNNKTYVRCKCDCGNEKIIDMNNIINGSIRSCGCLESESRYSRKHFIDITGRRFGKLIALEPTNEKYSNGSIIWKCLCDCGNITYANYSNLKNGQVTSCGCNHSSQWENHIDNLLKEYNINFESQKRFSDCTNSDGTSTLPFDFYIENINTIIEYDGEHHFKSIPYWGGDEKFFKTQQNDNIKNKFCEANNITLLRLPYTLSMDEIDEQILNILNP